MKSNWFLDVFFIAGLALMGTGLALWSVPLMLVVVGTIIMGLALIGAWRGRS